MENARWHRTLLKSCPANHSQSSDSPDILLSPREHEFSSTSWWLVDVESNDVITQGATPLVKRCMRVYNWDLAKTRRVLNAYRQFLHLKKCYEDWDATQLSPSYLVDQMWHQHILDVTNYCHDMMLLCGHVVGHNPDGVLDVGGKKIRDINTRRGLEDLFRGSYDAEIWGIQIQSNTNTGNAANNRSEAGSNTASTEDNTLTIRVKDQHGEETFFKIKASTQMGKIFRAYASRKGIDSSSLRFTLDGDEIEDYETPSTLELEDQDQIDAILEQRGC
eukprot:scaffold58585_cov65-Cyclotella_meneghiniana.AAC.3